MAPPAMPPCASKTNEPLQSKYSRYRDRSGGAVSSSAKIVPLAAGCRRSGSTYATRSEQGTSGACADALASTKTQSARSGSTRIKRLVPSMLSSSSPVGFWRVALSALLRSSARWRGQAQYVRLPGRRPQDGIPTTYDVRARDAIYPEPRPLARWQVICRPSQAPPRYGRGATDCPPMRSEYQRPWGLMRPRSPIRQMLRHTSQKTLAARQTRDVVRHSLATWRLHRGTRPAPFAAAVQGYE